MLNPTMAIMKRSLGFLSLALLAWSTACGTTTENTVEAGATPDASVPDGDSDAASPDGGACSEVQVGRLCVRGVAGGGQSGEALTAGGKVLFQVFPSGCRSSSSTTVVEASCAAQSASAGVVTVAGKFCLGSAGGAGSTPDCNGGGFANCEQAGLAAGKYTAKLDALEVAFEVPSTLPFGGTCVGSL